MTAGDMWQDLAVWIQRREMVEYCRLNYDVDKEEAKNLNALIDIALRNRIRGLIESIEQENLPDIRLPFVGADDLVRPLQKALRQQCQKCFHVNRVRWCQCECHQQRSPA